MTLRTRARTVGPAVLVMMTVTALSVLVPLLDRGTVPGEGLVREGPDPTAYGDHHHEICLQYGAAAWSSASEVQPPSGRLVRTVDDLRDSARRPGALFSPSHHSCAPPPV